MVEGERWGQRAPATQLVVNALSVHASARSVTGYAIEPLLLPGTASCTDGASDAPDGRECPTAVGAVERLADEAPLAVAASEEQLAWFRWITGHQVSFILWQLIGARLASPERADPDTQEAIADYVDGYSGMLLYSASCPRELYHRLVRPSMQAWHPAFSGSWAPDYGLVRNVMRNRHADRMDAVVRDAVELQKDVHDHVAHHLVPDGTSLLQAAQRQTAAQRKSAGRPMLSMLYDSYFQTLRAPVPRSVVVAQLIRRLARIVVDVRAHPLPQPDPEDLARLSPETAAGMTRLTSGLVDVCVRVARAAGDGDRRTGSARAGSALRAGLSVRG